MSEFNLNTEKTCIIVPCYNEEKRLDIDKFKEFPDPNIYFLFVNDGSTDGTLAILEKNRSERILVHPLHKNSGKAEAVRKAMMHLTGLPIFSEIKWVGYWDADLATPLCEIRNFFIYKEIFMPYAKAVFGSRIIRLGSDIRRKFSRHIIGRLFAIFVKIIFNLGTYDSQCGAKIFRKELVHEIFTEPFVSKWIFDVEIILRMKKNNRHIVESPLVSWEDIKGSKLMKISSITCIFSDLLKLWLKYG